MSLLTGFLALRRTPVNPPQCGTNNQANAYTYFGLGGVNLVYDYLLQQPFAYATSTHTIGVNYLNDNPGSPFGIAEWIAWSRALTIAEFHTVQVCAVPCVPPNL